MQNCVTKFPILSAKKKKNLELKIFAFLTRQIAKVACFEQLAMDGPTDQRTDKAADRVACTRLKTS